MKSLLCLFATCCLYSFSFAATTTARPLVWNTTSTNVETYLNLGTVADVNRLTISDAIVVTRIQVQALDGTYSTQISTGNFYPCSSNTNPNITLHLATGTTDIATLPLPNFIDGSKPPTNTGSNWMFGNNSDSGKLLIPVPAGAKLRLYFVKGGSVNSAFSSCLDAGGDVNINVQYHQK